MRILASQNLYGVLESDGTRWTALRPMGILSNGLCAGNGHIYVADWSEVHVLSGNGGPTEVVRTRAQNCHTVRLHGGRLLIASTADHSVVWGDEAVFQPEQHGLRPAPPHGYYLNAAIPWRDDTILIGMRSHRAVLFFDLERRRIERVITLPMLRNLHHPTGYGPDLFLVSDDSSVLMFDGQGKPVLRSPPFRWPRGIWVESRTRVWVADRRSISRWNPQTNRIERHLEFPTAMPSSLPERQGDVAAGAGFDVVGIPD